MQMTAYVFNVDQCSDMDLSRIIITVDRIEGLCLVDDSATELRIWIPRTAQWFFTLLYPGLIRVPELDIDFSPPL